MKRKFKIGDSAIVNYKAWKSWRGRLVEIRNVEKDEGTGKINYDVFYPETEDCAIFYSEHLGHIRNGLQIALKHSQKIKNGFTLIELIVLAAIVGILASVIVPKFLQFISRASCEENIRSEECVDYKKQLKESIDRICLSDPKSNSCANFMAEYNKYSDKKGRIELEEDKMVVRRGGSTLPFSGNLCSEKMECFREGESLPEGCRNITIVSDNGFAKACCIRCE